MGRKNSPGLYKRNNIWYIKKTIYGCTIRESTQTSDLAKAEEHLAFRVEQIRQQGLFGETKKRYFHEAMEEYVLYKQRFGKTTVNDDVIRAKGLWPYIAHLPLDEIHMGTLAPYIDDLRAKGRKNATINHGLQLVRNLLNLAATEWRDKQGQLWLKHPPKIRLLPKNDMSKPSPLSWEEQDRLFALLQPHLRNMAIFAVNTGCRDQEVCNLKWEWEYDVPELNTSIFIIPAWIENGQMQNIGMVKNRQDRLVVLNRLAQEVVHACRGNGSQYVFTHRGKPILKMLNSGWKTARAKAALPKVRVHDLKHTFGRRLRSAGVSFEDRQDLLGHKSSRITTHYSAAELRNLIEAANKVCSRTINLTIIPREHAKVGGIRPDASNDYVDQKPESQIRPISFLENRLANL